MRSELLKADLHIHTEYSMDCNTPLKKLIDRCLELGINCVAIADHGTIEGALRMQSIAPFPVIVAEEVLTPDGEIMGVFLKEGIPSGLSVEQVISHENCPTYFEKDPENWTVMGIEAYYSRMIE